MIHTVPYMTEDFDKLASGELTFIELLYPELNAKCAKDIAKNGDYVAVNEIFMEHEKRGRSCMFVVTDVREVKGACLCSVSPCRIEMHKRLSAPIYGGEVQE